MFNKYLKKSFVFGLSSLFSFSFLLDAAAQTSQELLDRFRDKDLAVLTQQLSHLDGFERLVNEIWSHSEPDFARRVSSSDLMVQQMKSLHGNFALDPVRLAIVDFGVNSSTTDDICPNVGELTNEDIQARFKDNSSPDVLGVDFSPANDAHVSANHGTTITSIIAGRGDIGIVKSNLRLSLYNVMLCDKEIKARYQGTLPGDINPRDICGYSVLQNICQRNSDPNGVTLIAVQFLDEDVVTGKRTLEQRIPDLSSDGCLVVVSAGNNSTDQTAKNAKMDDSILYVQSATRTGHVSSWSAQGEISAPGDAVRALGLRGLEVSGDEKIVYPQRQCVTTSNKMLTCIGLLGTSYAAPIVTGIAANVIQVLKEGPDFAILAPKDRVALVTFILKSAEIYGMVNGLRAIELARRWTEIPWLMKETQDPLNADDRVLAFDNLLHNPPDPVCSESRLKCQYLGKSEREACIKRGRRAIALCTNRNQTSPFLAEIAKDLYETETKLNKRYYSAGMFKRVLEDNSNQVPDVSSPKSSEKSKKKLDQKKPRL